MLVALLCGVCAVRAVPLCASHYVALVWLPLSRIQVRNQRNSVGC